MERTTDPGDGRSRLLAVTPPAGMPGQAHERMVDVFVSTVAEWDDDDIKGLAAGLTACARTTPVRWPRRAPAASPKGPDEPPTKMTHREVLESLSGILLGMFVSILATSVVSSSLPRIISDLDGTQCVLHLGGHRHPAHHDHLHADLGQAGRPGRPQAAGPARAVALRVLLGARRAVAQSTGWLIGMRALQGIGAGGLTALGKVLIADLITPRERGRYMGFMGAVMGVGMVGGPLLGGVITDRAGLALVLLRRPAVRRRRDRGAPAHAAPARAPGAQGEDRLPGRDAALGRHRGPAALGHVRGHPFDWASWQTAAMVAGGLAAAGRGHLGRGHRATSRSSRCTCSRTARWSWPSSPASSVGVALFGTSVFLSQYMQLARGKSPDRIRPADHPDDRRHAGLLDHRRAADQPDRPVQEVHGRRARPCSPSGLALMGILDDHTSLSSWASSWSSSAWAWACSCRTSCSPCRTRCRWPTWAPASALVTFFRTLGGALGVSVLGAVLGSPRQRPDRRRPGGPRHRPGAMGGGRAIPDVARCPARSRPSSSTPSPAASRRCSWWPRRSRWSR